MRSAPIPPHEPARLALLRSLDILDTGSSDTANAIATAAASIADVPMSAISLVDADRQWFKAACGLATQQTTREISFCAHAMLIAEPLIVPDARSDERFFDNPLVTGTPHIRFYAGFALRVNGLALGALCLIDDIPRSLSTSQIARLQDLAALTSDWIASAERRPK